MATMKRLVPVLASVVAGGISIAAPASAQSFPPITSRDWAVDLYDGVALGSNRVIAMGGASVAVAEGSAGALSNPSASSVRASTDNDWFAWDFHLDAASGTFSTDYDNNGFLDGNRGNRAFTAGLALSFGKWGASIVGTTWTTPMEGLGASVSITANVQRAELAVARTIPQIDVVIGAALRNGSFYVDQGEQKLFGIESNTAVLGATWMPRFQNFRIGSSFAFGSTDNRVTGGSCDPNNCQGYILPDRISVPSRIAVGGSYRFAATLWGTKVPSKFRDERSLLLTSEIAITSATADGFGIEAFGQGGLQPSGQHVSASPRVGAEYEWLPGRLRLRAGSYWEPSRFADASGRTHVTAGLELALVSFRFFGPRRIRFTITTDIARNYRNGGLSVGFWH
jgi:hypothetical protein